MSPDQFAANAEALVGTRFRLGGRDPAAGLDCVGLAAWALGPRVVAPHGYALRNSTIACHLQFAARAGFSPVGGAISRGDLILVTPGPAQHHLLIALAPARFVHAHAGLRRVVVHAGAAPWPLLRHWRLTQTGT